jgi:hypothetical protein
MPSNFSKDLLTRVTLIGFGSTQHKKKWRKSRRKLEVTPYI